MRKTIVILTFALAIAATFTSCASSRSGAGARGGCKMSQGYIGYGGR